MNALTLRHAHTVPAILANAGENAATKFLEFFVARIRNLNTREAYARACAQFLAWSENHVNDIRAITPMHVAAYIEQHSGSPQTIKQHLAAIKMLFDYLVVSQIVPVLGELADRLELKRDRVVIIPGNHDVNRKDCLRYFEKSIEGGEPIVAPWYAKWKEYEIAFNDFYEGISGTAFQPGQPWSLFRVPELEVVVAGLNSTWIEGHAAGSPSRPIHRSRQVDRFVTRGVIMESDRGQPRLVERLRSHQLSITWHFP
jgi:hypothetical protein